MSSHRECKSPLRHEKALDAFYKSLVNLRSHKSHEIEHIREITREYFQLKHLLKSGHPTGLLNERIQRLLQHWRHNPQSLSRSKSPKKSVRAPSRSQLNSSQRPEEELEEDLFTLRE
jgi:hypothetical protein